MKVMMILGSRNLQGQTARAAEAIRQGMEAAGSEVEVVFLPKLHLDHCHQCQDSGWGRCAWDTACGGADDDFMPLVEKLKAADAVVFATPVYWGDLSESLRAFLDRLRRISWHAPDTRLFAGKKAIGICVAGGGGGGAPTCTVSLENVLSTCGFDLVDLIPVRRQNLQFKLGILRETGKWLAAGAPEE